MPVRGPQRGDGLTPTVCRDRIATVRTDANNSLLSQEEALHAIDGLLYQCLSPYYDGIRDLGERNDPFLLFTRAAFLLGHAPTIDQWSKILGYTVVAEVCRAERASGRYDALAQRYATEYANGNPYENGGIGPMPGLRYAQPRREPPRIRAYEPNEPIAAPAPQITLDFESLESGMPDGATLQRWQREMVQAMTSEMVQAITSTDDSAITRAVMGINNAAAPTVAPAPTPAPPAREPRGDWHCHECEEAFSGDDAHTPMHAESDASDRDVCLPCADDSGNYVQLANGHYATDDETASCYACDDTVLSHDTEEIDGETVCNRCVSRDRGVVYCVDDDARHLRENAYYDSNGGEWYYDSDNVPESDPEDDDGERADEDTLVYGYSTNVLAIKGRKAFIDGSDVARDLRVAPVDKALLFGVELETSTKNGYERSEIAREVLQTSFSQYGICKADGTVSGPELVTLPADLQSHRSVYQWREWCKSLTECASGYHSENEDGQPTAGMHVHINRAAVSPLTAGKMLVFMNREDNRDWLEFIAQREVSQNRYCKFKNDKRLTDAADGRVNDDRYEALNVTRHTIEVRIFRANLSEKRIYKNLEFCHALVKWCELESAQELTAERMQAYVMANRADYPHLAKFIETRSEDR